MCKTYLTYVNTTGDQLSPVELDQAKQMEYALLNHQVLLKKSIGVNSFLIHYEEFCKFSVWESDFNISFLKLDTKYIGICYWKLTDEDKTANVQYCEIYGMYIKEEYRNKGYGKKLFKHTLNQIYKKYPNAQIALTVTATNEAAIKLYKASGFTTTSAVTLVKPAKEIRT